MERERNTHTHKREREKRENNRGSRFPTGMGANFDDNELPDLVDPWDDFTIFFVDPWDDFTLFFLGDLLEIPPVGRDRISMGRGNRRQEQVLHQVPNMNTAIGIRQGTGYENLACFISHKLLNSRGFRKALT